MAYDSDGDDEGGGGGEKSAPPTTNEKKHHHADPGMASLLADLSKSAPAGKMISGTKTVPSNSTNTPMGFSFMQTTTEVIRQSTSSAATEKLAPPENVLVETVHSDSSSSEEDDAPTVSKESVSKPQLRPSETAMDFPKPTASYGKRLGQHAGIRAPAPSVSSIPRLSAPRIVIQSPSAAAPAAARPPQSSYQQQTIAAPSEKNARARKRSRQQMEKALRRGDLDAIADNEFEHLQQQAPDSYMLPQDQQHHQQQGHGIKVAPVAMYDTKQGQGVIGAAAGKARGKNQINYLMASAAAYEADQQVVTSAQKMKIYRTNAKQKYGW